MASNGSDISQVMKIINVSYVMYINRKRIRCEHLFQDRFRSEIITNDAYTLQVLKYIYLNPVKAGLVASPEKYQWSSYTEYMEQPQVTDRMVDRSFLLGFLANDLSSTQKRYREYIGLSELQQLPCHADCRGMISSVVEVERKKMSLEKCKAFVAKHIHQIHHEQTGGRGKENSERTRLVKELRCNSNLSLKEIGKLVELSESRVSRIIKSAEKQQARTVPGNKKALLAKEWLNVVPSDVWQYWLSERSSPALQFIKILHLVPGKLGIFLLCRSLGGPFILKESIKFCGLPEDSLFIQNSL